MQVYRVKHNPLLRRESRTFSRADVAGYIDKLIDNLIHIHDESGEFLLHMDDGRTIDTKGWAGWEWTHGIGLYGIYQYYQLTGKPQPREIVDQWFADSLPERIPTKNVNTVCPFLTLAYRYEEEPRPEWRPYLEEWARWVMHDMPRTEHHALQHIVYNSENDQQIWDDTLMMSVMPLAKIGKLLDKPEYIEEAKYQFLIHAHYLSDRHSGAWFHGWTFKDKHNFAHARWARGNSWLTVAIPDFIELLDLPESDALRRHLLSVLTCQVEMLSQCQDDSGLWHTLLDDSSSYLESSATAGFAYGILKAIRLRYLDKRYALIAEKAVQGIIGNINEEGELKHVSFGTAMGEHLDYYREIPLTSMPYGQAMGILCLSEYLRTYI